MPDETTDTQTTDNQTTDTQTTDTQTTDNEDGSTSGKDVGAHNLFVRDDHGDGRPAVLIHGWPLSHTSWAPQEGALREAGYRVVAYDRRGFGASGPGDSYDYDALSDDLDNVLSDLDLREVTLVGFSMGGGEVARYLSRHGKERIHSVVFAAAVPPFLMKSEDNPDGPLVEDAAKGMRQGLEDDRDAFFGDFTRQFFTAGDDLLVDEAQLKDAVTVCQQSDQDAALGCVDAFATTDFRKDLEAVDIPTLVIHGDSDGIVPIEGSGKLTHEAVAGSDLVVIEGGPHGLNLTHADEFNSALVGFLDK